jgi:hypothetical protein
VAGCRYRGRDLPVPRILIRSVNVRHHATEGLSDLCKKAQRRGQGASRRIYSKCTAVLQLAVIRLPTERGRTEMLAGSRSRTGKRIATSLTGNVFIASFNRDPGDLVNGLPTITTTGCYSCPLPEIMRECRVTAHRYDGVFST